MAKRTSRLGKGLNALIPPRDPNTGAPTPTTPAAVALAADSGHVRQIPIDKIKPNPKQPRTNFDEAGLTHLADSIREAGIIQPVILRAGGDHTFELVAGERRWRAARLAGLQAIPALVRELSDAQSFKLALIENLQREDLSPLERAAAYQHYLDSFGGSIEDLAKRLSEGRATISNHLRLLKLQPELCYMLGRGELGMGQARAIAGVADPQRQLAFARLAIRRNLSVRQVEELCRAAGEEVQEKADEGDAAAADGRRRHVAEVERSFAKALGLRVRLYPGRRKNAGRVVISYASLEEFDRIAERLGGAASRE